MTEITDLLRAKAEEWQKFADTHHTKGQRISDARKEGQRQLLMAGQSLAYAMAAAELLSLIPVIEQWIAAKREKVLEEAAKVECEWCRQGNIPQNEPGFCQPTKLWHKIYDNWLVCSASAIRFLGGPRHET